MRRNYFKKLLSAISLSILLGISSGLKGADIIVNAGGSIQAAVNQANPGDVILVSSGTYAEKVVFSAANSGASGSVITLKANGVVTINGSSLSPSGREGLITVSGASYVRVEGFVLTNFKTTGTNNTPMGILVDNGATNVALIDNKISDIEHNKTNCTQNNDCYVGAHGIGVFGNTTTAISNVLIQGNEVFNCDLMSSEAFVLNGNIDGFEIYDNIVHDNDNIGFDFIGYEPWDCSSCTPEQLRVKNGLVAGNQAYKNSSLINPWYTGDKSAGGFYVDGGRNIIFAGNISYENDFGFEFASEWNNRKTEDILMVNNVVYNNTETGLILGGYSSSTGNVGDGGGGGSADNIYVYNNTFYGNAFAQITFQYRVTNSSFFNNILYNTDGTASEGFGNWCSSNCAESNNSWGSNTWYSLNGNGSGFPGSNNTIGDPQFAAIGTDFTIGSGSVAINSGATQANLTDWNDSFWIGFFYANGDIPAHGTMVNSTVVDGAGNSRFQGVVDAGAYEYGSGGGGTVPNDPSSLNATAASSSLINLSWTDNSGDEDDFEVQQSLTGTSGWTQVAIVGSNSTSASITNLSPSTTYFYRIRARNTVGNSSFASTASATTQASGGGGTVTVDDEGFESGWGIWNDGGSDARRSSADAVYANTGTYCIRLRDDTNTSVMTTDNLDLSSYSSLMVSFSYQARSMDYSSEGFLLQISTNGGSSFATSEEWNRDDEFVNNAFYSDQVTISGLFTSTTKLRFRCDGSGNSDWVYIDDVVITATSSGGGSAPAAPSSLSAIATSSAQVNLSWSDNSNDEVDFQVQRSLTGTGNWSQITVASANATNFSNIGLVASTTYYYRVRARNASGNSGWTAVSSATTQSGGGTSINIDGNSSDWSSISTLASNGGTSLKVYDDASDIYFLLSGGLSSHSLIFINTDNASSGYGYGWSDGGMDYFAEDAAILYDYTGSGSDWSWSEVSGAVTGAIASDVELKVSKANLSGLGSTIKIGVSIEDSNWSQTNSVPAVGSASVSYVMGSSGSRVDADLSDLVELGSAIQEMVVFPNPASSVLNIQDIDEGQEIRIYGALGDLIFEGLDQQIDISNFNAGIYFVRVDGKKVLRVVKK